MSTTTSTFAVDGHDLQRLREERHQRDPTGAGRRRRRRLARRQARDRHLRPGGAARRRRSSPRSWTRVRRAGGIIRRTGCSAAW
ncbi:MAG: hypothetical protein MZW92_67475 [Comamonadaceae bacterium]|nr:hypothetical protein [Comamonadaceae bacterium]